MARLDQERQKEFEPKRIEYAIEKITALGYTISHKDDTKIQFVFKDSIVTLFPYSGRHSGKSIKDGRGIDKLLAQIKTH